MKELSVTNYKSVLPKELLKAAESNKVRECDEATKGHYVAYVDESNDTFDVSLTFSPDKKMIAHTCDCNNGGGFCRHKAALLVHVAKGPKTIQSIQTKKQNKAEAILQETEPDDLKEWVRSLLEKNKDLELSFIHYFSTKQQQYTPEEVVKLTTDAVKAVVKRQKYLDPTQIKKVVELWTTIHAPIIKAYQFNVVDEKAFVNFHTLIETCLTCGYNANTSSNRVFKYIEGLLQQSTEIINNLFDDDSWKTALDYFIQNTYEQHTVRMHYVNFFKSIISISSAARRSELIKGLSNLHKSKREAPLVEDSQFTKFLFDSMHEDGCILAYLDQFAPITFDNEFNIKLIRLCMDNGLANNAKQFCHKIIQKNFHEEYDIPYLLFLKEMYEAENDEANLSLVLSRLLPFTYNFDDFLFIQKSIEDVEEQKKWTLKILARIRNASKNGNLAATEFLFELLQHEKKYIKMIELISSSTPYSIILKHLHPMALSNKDAVLLALINRSDDLGGAHADDARYFPQLLDTILTYFTTDHIKLIFKRKSKRSYYFTPNNFVKYVLSVYDLNSGKAV